MTAPRANSKEAHFALAPFRAASATGAASGKGAVSSRSRFGSTSRALIVSPFSRATSIRRPSCGKVETSQTRLQKRRNNGEKSGGKTDDGDPGRSRTADLPLRRRLLYPLSYEVTGPV